MDGRDPGRQLASGTHNVRCDMRDLRNDRCDSQIDIGIHHLGLDHVTRPRQDCRKSQEQDTGPLGSTPCVRKAATVSRVPSRKTVRSQSPPRAHSARASVQLAYGTIMGTMFDRSMNIRCAPRANTRRRDNPSPAVHARLSLVTQVRYVALHVT